MTSEFRLLYKEPLTTPLPKWFTYTNFRAFLREGKVDKKEFGHIGGCFHCALCSFVEQYDTERVRCTLDHFTFANKVYPLPQWAQSFLYDGHEKAFEDFPDDGKGIPASWYLTLLNEIDAREGTGLK